MQTILKFQSKPVGNSSSHVGISPSSDLECHPWRAVPLPCPTEHMCTREKKGTSAVLFTLFLLLINTCRTTWMVWDVKCHVHTEAILALAKPKRGFGFITFIDRKSVWLQWQQAQQLSQHHCSCKTELSCWPLVTCTALDKSLICFLRWLMSKIGRPLAHYKGEIRKNYTPRCTGTMTTGLYKHQKMIVKCFCNGSVDLALQNHLHHCCSHYPFNSALSREKGRGKECSRKQQSTGSRGPSPCQVSHIHTQHKTA